MVDPIYTIVGERIEQARKGKMTQEDLASRVRLSRTSIVNIEAGRQRFCVDTLHYIATALGVSVCSLVAGETNTILPTDTDEEWAAKWWKERKANVRNRDDLYGRGNTLREPGRRV